MKVKYALFFASLFLICLSACKKQSTLPFENSKTLIVGKWFVKSFASRLYYNGAEVDSAFNSNFTSSDYAEYFSDGTGIFSSYDQPSPSLVTFNYTISGPNLTQINAANTPSIPETITVLTSENLSFNYTLLVNDPNSGKIFTEKDVYDFSK
jgi:hypothetical protein